MRLFLFNQETVYPFADICDRSKSKTKDARKEIANLIAIGLIKKRSTTREITIKRKKRVIVKKVHDQGYILDQKFSYLQALKNLLLTASLHADDTLVKRFANVGRLKVFAASGLFIQEWDARVDLLIVGDDLNQKRLASTIEAIEAEVGKKIDYSAFETSDFEYRYGIHDRLIRDILDGPRVLLVDKLDIQGRV